MSRAARVLAAVVGVVVLIGAVALAWAWGPRGSAPQVAAPPATPELIARGKYVAEAADCVACHTVAGGTPFAGGRAFTLPFGTIYSPNITPDRETGIGDWTDGEFLRALHQGVRRDGQQLYPAFPYTSYAGMTDADALALKAYLFSLQPVHAPARANTLSFPFDQRPLMRFWNLLFLPRAGFRPDPNKPQAWNRGAYLVTALGHCGECHTPRNFMYGLESGKALSGETIQGWSAWNITSDPDHGIGGWAPDDLAAYLRWGYTPGRGAAGGPMKEAVDNSLSKLTPQDLQAIAVYLKGTKPIARGPRIDPNPPSLAASSFSAPGASEPDSAGQRLFAGACEGCHAWNGQGRQTPMADLRGLPSVNDPLGLNVVQTILHGNSVAAPQGQAAMPSFSAAYSDAEIAAMSGYVVQHFGGKASRVTAKTVAQARRD